MLIVEDACVTSQIIYRHPNHPGAELLYLARAHYPGDPLRSKQSKDHQSPIFVGMFTWCCAILSYYIYYAILFSLGRLPHLEHLIIFGQDFHSLRTEYWRIFKRIILFQFLEWIPITVISGGHTGAIIWWILQRLNRKNPN